MIHLPDSPAVSWLKRAGPIARRLNLESKFDLNAPALPETRAHSGSVTRAEPEKGSR